MNRSDLNVLYRRCSVEDRHELLYLLSDHSPEVAVALALAEAGRGCTAAQGFLRHSGRKAGARALVRLRSGGLWQNTEEAIADMKAYQDRAARQRETLQTP